MANDILILPIKLRPGEREKAACFRNHELKDGSGITNAKQRERETETETETERQMDRDRVTKRQRQTKTERWRKERSE